MESMVNKFCQMYEGEKLAMSPGEQKMYFCYVDDVVDPTRYGRLVPEWKPKISYEEGIRMCGDYDLAHMD